MPTTLGVCPSIMSRPWCALLVLLVAASVSAAGCAPTHNRPDALYRHAIRFDEDGRTVDPRDGRTLSPAETAAQFKAILHEIDQALADKPQRRILIFVHGGLNDPEDALNGAAGVMQRMQSSGLPGYPPFDGYPLFVIWNSSLDATYNEHLFAIRQGRKDADTEAAARFTWPLYLVSDLLRALARVPTVWLQQRQTDDEAAAAALASMSSFRAAGASATSPSAAPTAEDRLRKGYAEAWVQHPRNGNVLAFYEELNRRYFEDYTAHQGQVTTQMALSIGPDESRPSDWVGRGTGYTLTLPAKMLTAPLIDAFGTAAWQNMSRRTQTILEGSSDFVVGPDTTAADVRRYVDRGTDGGLDHFITELAQHAHAAPGATTRPYQVTLVGHSMGSMVLNEVLRRQARREAELGDLAARSDLPVTDIVYMAAACSIRDFSQAVVPFMERPGHEGVHFYNLCLHPTADLIETNFADLPPRGSLLCWLDDFLAQPSTPLDRTLGRWENLLRVPYVVPQKLRRRVSIKAFALHRRPDGWESAPDPQPQRHGDFSAAPYWHPRFWQPGPPVDPNQGRMKGIRAVEQKRRARAAGRSGPPEQVGRSAATEPSEPPEQGD